MNKRRVLVNIFSSGIQVLIVGVVYFFLYRFLLTQLNVKLLGVWSVVLATSSLANLANFGVASSVVRYVALYSTEGDFDKVRKLVFTSSGFLFCLFVGLSLIIYPFANLILRGIIGNDYLQIALQILPFSIACLIINEVGGVFASVLDGLQRNYIRSIIFTLSTALLLGLSFWLTPLYGLKGVAYAQFIQSVFTFSVCLIVLIAKTKYNPFKYNWDKKIFKEIFAYGMKFQFLSITGMLCDPITKTLITKFGGLNFTGYYEMASRLVNQVKGVIINANQSLVPVIIHQAKNEPSEKNYSLYKINIIVVFYFSLLVFSILITMSGLISKIWIGNEIPFFLNCVILLCIAAFVNLLCNPAYFSSIASGNLNILIYSQVFMAVGNLILGFICGYFFGAFGVIGGWVIASAYGSVYLIKIYQNRNGILLKHIFGFKSLAVLCLVILILLTRYFVLNANNQIIVNAFVLLLITGIFSWESYTIYNNKNHFFDLEKEK